MHAGEKVLALARRLSLRARRETDNSVDGLMERFTALALAFCTEVNDTVKDEAAEKIAHEMITDVFAMLKKSGQKLHKEGSDAT